MRVITGSARGRKLKTLDGADVRPTADRVKEGIFSAIQFDVEGRRVLDLFAGSGQLGIEAISRGAESATFVDASAESIRCVRENVSALGFDSSAKIVRSDFASFLSVTKDRFDIAFLDPPYRTGLLQRAVSAVAPVMSDAGVIICEHPIDDTQPDTVGDFRVSKVYRYGKILVSVYRKGL
jgi:16S rRNA (guanine966-N2)-methyltransferase